MPQWRGTLPYSTVRSTSCVSEHCDKELLPDYWHEFDYVGEASDASFEEFFRHHFDHCFESGKTPRHASGSLGYRHYCETGELSKETRDRVERSRNMAIYREILAGARLGLSAG